MILEINELSRLDEISKEIAKNIKKSVIYLHGDLGSGKTTFAKLLLKNLGYSGVVTSPTYNIINEYSIDDKNVIHADLYRLNYPDELFELNVREWGNIAGIILIEWSEKGFPYLPEADYNLYFSLEKGKRFLEIKKRFE